MSVIVHCSRWNAISGLSRPDSWRYDRFLFGKSFGPAHVLIAMLALKIVRDAQEHLKTASDENERLSLQDALRALSRLCLHRYRLRDDVEFLRLPPLDNRQVLICNALGIRPPSQKQFSVGRRQIKSQ